MTEDTELIYEVRPQDFDRDVLAKSGECPIIVDFWASWCGPCRTLGPVLERVVRSLQGQALLAKVNIEGGPELAAKWGIRSIPAVKVFRNGKVIGEFVGALPEPEIRRRLSAILPSRADELTEEGALLENNGDWRKAEAKYREALALEPGHLRAAVRLAEAALNRGDDREARELIAKAGVMNPRDAAVEALQARLWFIDRCAGAGGFDACRGAAAERPDDVALRCDAACCLAAQAEYAAALEELLAVVRLDRNFGKGAPRDAMVRIFAILGDQSELARTYRSALSSALYV